MSFLDETGGELTTVLYGREAKSRALWGLIEQHYSIMASFVSGLGHVQERGGREAEGSGT